MGSQERFLIAPALIGTVGGTLIAGQLFSSASRFYPALDEDQQPVESESTQTVRHQFPD